MTVKKPIKVSNGDYIVGSNFKTRYFTEMQTKTYTKKSFSCKNKNLKKINNDYRYKFIGLKRLR